MVEDRDSFCPSEMSDVFTELQDSYFFCLKTSVANNHEDIPYQPMFWRVFTSATDKNYKKQ